MDRDRIRKREEVLSRLRVRVRLGRLSGIRGNANRGRGPARGDRAGRWSRGMRQKLGLILALAHRPRLLILTLALRERYGDDNVVATDVVPGLTWTVQLRTLLASPQ